jgi:hypothetical protein
MRTTDAARSLFKLLSTLGVLLILQAHALQTPPAPSDPFLQKTPGFALDHQTIVDGIAKLSEETDIPYSVEFPLGRTISGSASRLKSLNARIPSNTLVAVLDQLCQLDGSFAWIRIGNSAHLLPRALEGNPDYLLNRKLSVLELHDVGDAQKAVFQVVNQLSGDKKEQIAVMQSGVSLAFSRAWTATLRDITVREAFDRIAQQLGGTCGWQFGGAADFRVLTFHQRLLPKAPARGKVEPIEHP